MNELKDQNIGSQVHYIPIIDQPFYMENVEVNGDFNACREYYSKALSLPIYPSMTNDDVERVIQYVKELLK